MNLPKSTLRQFIAVIVAASFAGAVPHAFAKACFSSEDEMIERAEVIAIVDISRVEKTEAQGKDWKYSEVARATVQQTLKGKLSQAVDLHGGENFICAQVHFAPGRHLVFLRCDGEFLVGCNWHLGVRLIKDTQVEWFVAGDRGKLSWQPLDAVLERIKSPRVKPNAK